MMGGCLRPLSSDLAVFVQTEKTPLPMNPRRSSGRESAHFISDPIDQSRLTSAATVQGFNARVACRRRESALISAKPRMRGLTSAATKFRGVWRYCKLTAWLALPPDRHL